MPRLVHQYLSQQTHAEQDNPMRESIDKLIQAQQKQAKWQQNVTWAILLLVAVQIATFAFFLM
jgi:ubiquinone biosynthesis protein